MANKHIKKCSSSPAIKMQIKTTWRVGELLRSQEHLLLLQGAQVRGPASTRWLKRMYDSRSTGSFLATQGAGMYMVQFYTERQSTHTHRTEINISKLRFDLTPVRM